MMIDTRQVQMSLIADSVACDCKLLSGIREPRISDRQRTVLQLSIRIIYNSAWSILIQWIREILSGDDLT